MTLAPGSVISFHTHADTLTYEAFFGLREKAFSLNADPRFLFHSQSHATALENLVAGIRRREGLLVLTGEIGTGKTMLCQAVLKELGRKTFSSFVPDPFASREDLLKMLLIDFGVLTVEELTKGSLQRATRTELSYLLAGFLESLAPLEAFVVVVIDEAQNMSLSLIEETRILSDSFGGKGGLQIVFVGQPELHAKMKLPEMRQVDQRVCCYNHLAPLSREAVAGYIQHRLYVAGLSRERVLFSPDVLDVLHRRTGGVPRLINRVCDRALHLAHREQAAWVNKENLETALIDVGPSVLTPTWDAIIVSTPAVLAQPAAATVATPAPVATPEIVATSEPVAHDEPVASSEPVATPGSGPWQSCWPDIVASPEPVPTLAPVPAATASPQPAPDESDVAHFDQTVDEWLTQGIGPAFRTASSPLPVASRFAETTAPAPKGWADTHGGLRCETYLERQLRVWTRRAAVAATFIVVVGAVVATINRLPARLTGPVLTPPVMPALPVAPAFIAPGLVAASAGAPEAAAPAVAAPEAVAPPTPAPLARLAPPAPAGGYLVAVGLFANLDRADELVRELTRAGLPAIQQPYQLRNVRARRVMLGPFTSRADAFTGLQRLRQLGKHDDARVVDTTGEPTAP